MRVAIGFAVIGLLSTGAVVGAQTPLAEKPAPKQRQTSTFEIHEASGPIRVDGSLDEEAWKTATTIPLAYAHLTDRDIPFNDDTVASWSIRSTISAGPFSFGSIRSACRWTPTNSDVDGSEDCRGTRCSSPKNGRAPDRRLCG